MPEENLFHDILTEYRRRAGSPSRFTVFDHIEANGGKYGSRVSIPTLNNWFQGKVKSPRDWRSILAVVEVFHNSLAAEGGLTEQEVDRLLTACGHKQLAALRADYASGGKALVGADAVDVPRYLAYWPEGVQLRELLARWWTSIEVEATAVPDFLSSGSVTTEGLTQQVRVHEGRPARDRAHTPDNEQQLEVGLMSSQVYHNPYTRPRVGRDQERARDWDDVRDQYRRLVVLGDPGFGKSWLLGREAARVAKAARQGDGTAVVWPLWTRLDGLAERLDEGTEFWDAVAQATLSTTSRGLDSAARSELVAAVVDHVSTGGKVRLVLDSLDEVPIKHRQLLDRQLRDNTSDNPNVSVVLASRLVGYVSPIRLDPRSDRQVELVGFTPSQVGAFIDHWFAEAPDTAARLRQHLVHHSRLESVAQVPLLCAFLCLANSDDSAIPQRRADLYDTVVEKLLFRPWHPHLGPTKAIVDSRRELLTKLAWELATGESHWRDRLSPTAARPVLIDAHDNGVAWTVPKPDIGDNNDLRAENELAELEGILVPDGTEPGSGWLFVHRTIHEYLVAAHLADPVNNYDIVDELRPRWWFQPDWYETIALAAALTTPSDAAGLIQAIADDEPDTALAGTYLRAHVLADLPPNTPDAGTVDRLAWFEEVDRLTTLRHRPEARAALIDFALDPTKPSWSTRTAIDALHDSIASKTVTEQSTQEDASYIEAERRWASHVRETFQDRVDLITTWLPSVDERGAQSRPSWNGSVEHRRGAVRALAATKTPEALHFLKGLISRPTPDLLLQVHVAEALGVDEPQALHALIDLMSNRRATQQERREAVRALGASNAPEALLLLKRLVTDQTDWGAHVADSEAGWTEEDPEAHQAYRELVERRRAVIDVGLEAVRSLGASRSPEALLFLRGLVADRHTDWLLRVHAAEVLGVDVPEALEILTQLVTPTADERRWSRSYDDVQEMLALAGVPEARQAFIKYLEDPTLVLGRMSAGLRLHAAEALGVEEPIALQTLIHLATDRTEIERLCDVKQYYLASLEECVRRDATEALGTSNASEARHTIEQLVADQSNNWRVRAAAALILGAEVPDALQALTELIADGRLPDDTRESVIDALGGSKTPEALNALLDYATGRPIADEGLRGRAAEALGTFSAPEVLDTLVDLATDSRNNQQVRFGAAEGLGSSDVPEFRDALIRLVTSQPELGSVLADWVPRWVRGRSSLAEIGQVRQATAAAQAAWEGHLALPAYLRDAGAAVISAMADYEQAIALDPTNAAAFTDRGTLHIQLGQDERAIADYEQAIALDPTNAAALVEDYQLAITNRGLLLEDEGKIAEAQSWYQRFADAGNTDAMNSLAWLLYYWQEELDEAERWARRAVERFDVARPEIVDDALAAAMDTLGMVLKAKADVDWNEAAVWLRRAAEADNPEAMFNLGTLLVEHNRSEGSDWLALAEELGFEPGRPPPWLSQ